jgi:hypothetical protein
MSANLSLETSFNTSAKKWSKKDYKKMKLRVEKPKKEPTAVGQVFKTKDYSMFKLLPLNRDITNQTLSPITDSLDYVSKEFGDLTKNGYIPVPIIVNENYEIIDGQNRFTALQSRGGEIYYYVIPGLTIDHVNIFQNGKPWRENDWLKLWKGKGKKDYSVYETFRNKYNVGHWTTIGLLYGESYPKGENRNTIWQNGKFVVNLLQEATELMDKVQEIRPYLNSKLINKKGVVKRDFIYALKKVLEFSDFSFDRFLKNIQLADAPSIQNLGDSEGFMEAILDVHNHGLSDDVKLKIS